MGSVAENFTFSHCAQLVSITSIILGAAVTLDSGWLVYKLTKEMQDPAFKHAKMLLNNLNQFMEMFGGQVPKGGFGVPSIDIEHMFRVTIISCSVALVGGIIQFVMSCWLLRATVKESEGHAGKAWVCSHVIVMCALAGSFLGVITLEAPLTTRLKVFLGITGTDIFLLIYFLWFVFGYERKRSRGIRTDMYPT